jgi:FtsH-binding integral membrane protein
MEFGKLYPVGIFQICKVERSFLMKLRILFIVHMIVMLILAAGLLLAPRTIVNLFGLNVGTTVSFNASMNFVAQLLGATLVVPALVSFFASTMEDMGARRSMAIVLLIFNIIAFVVSIFVGMLPRVMTSAGWILVLVFLLFSAGFAYFLFMRTEDI